MSYFVSGGGLSGYLCNLGPLFQPHLLLHDLACISFSLDFIVIIISYML